MKMKTEKTARRTRRIIMAFVLFLVAWVTAGFYSDGIVTHVAYLWIVALCVFVGAGYLLLAIITWNEHTK